MLVLPLFCVILIWYLIICYKWKKNIFDHMEKIPGLKWYPIFGTSYAYLGTTRENVLYKFLELLGQYRPFMKTWSSNIPEIHAMKADHLQIIMKSSAHTTKGPFYQFLFPWLGEGLFTSEGAKWFLQRKLLTPTFHFKILEGFVEIFGEKAKLLAKGLEQKADGKYFHIVPDVACCTLSVICEAAMGVPLNAVTDKPLEYVKNLHEITEMAMWRYWKPYVTDPIFYLLPQGRRYKQLVKDLHSFSDKVVACKKENMQSNNHKSSTGSDNGKKQHLAFLDLVIDATDYKNTLSDSDLRALVETFLGAGYETTATGICWALYLLGHHPEIQEKLLQEVEHVLKDKEAPTTATELNELKYVECVVKESLRLYPILPFITRTLTEDIEIDNYKVPAGTQAILHIFQVQRDPEHFSEPNKFDPDRFLPENTKTRHPFAYIPFSAGPRNCIGMRFALMEFKTVLATIIKRFKVTSLEAPEDLKVFAHLILRSQSGINVKLEIRNQ